MYLATCTPVHQILHELYYSSRGLPGARIMFNFKETLDISQI